MWQLKYNKLVIFNLPCGTLMVIGLEPLMEDKISSTLFFMEQTRGMVSVTHTVSGCLMICGQQVS